MTTDARVIDCLPYTVDIILYPEIKIGTVGTRMPKVELGVAVTICRDRGDVITTQPPPSEITEQRTIVRDVIKEIGTHQSYIGRIKPGKVVRRQILFQALNEIGPRSVGRHFTFYIDSGSLAEEFLRFKRSGIRAGLGKRDW